MLVNRPGPPADTSSSSAFDVSERLIVKGSSAAEELPDAFESVSVLVGD